MTNTTKNPPCYIYYIYGKRSCGGSTAWELVSGIAYGIAQTTAVVCVESPEMILFTACARKIFTHVRFAFTYHIYQHILQY